MAEKQKHVDRLHNLDHEPFFKLVIDLACEARLFGENAAAALIVDGKGMLLAAAHDNCLSDDSPIAHAPLLAINQAMWMPNDGDPYSWSLYSTAVPCTMCSSAAVLGKIGRIGWISGTQQESDNLKRFLHEDQPYAHGRNIELTDASP